MTAPMPRTDCEVAVIGAGPFGLAVASSLKAAGVDTLDGFIRDMKVRFPDATARGPLPASEPIHTGSLPAIVGIKQAGAAY